MRGQVLVLGLVGVKLLRVVKPRSPNGNRRESTCVNCPQKINGPSERKNTLRTAADRERNAQGLKREKEVAEDLGSKQATASK